MNATRAMPDPLPIQRCDWCHEWATRISHHERPNGGTLVAYWCEAHYVAAQRTNETPTA